jgi:hypothetical protein
MNKMMIAMAVTVALAFCLNGGLLAADTSPATALNHPKISGTSTNQTLKDGWYGPGWDGGFGYFNPARSGQYNPYPYYNIVGGAPYGPLYEPSLPDQNESPFNPPAALARHGLVMPAQMQRTSSLSLRKKAARAVSSPGFQDVH